MGIYEQPALAYGTINAAGTLSSQIILGEKGIAGLIVTTAMVAGTLSFMVSDKSDEEGGVYYDVKAPDGTNIGVGSSGTFAVGANPMAYIESFQYVRVKTSVTQTNGLRFAIVTKG
jgi:hypothetical protein